MSEPVEHRVICRYCRYRFPVQASAAENWVAEVECPSCEKRYSATEADTRERPPPDPGELDAIVNRLGEVLWRPIRAHSDHPALAWFDRVGNGIFEDDHSQHCWPIPHWIYRFTRRRQAAYIWCEDGKWFVRAWHPMRGRRSTPTAAEVVSFPAALDSLATDG